MIDEQVSKGIFQSAERDKALEVGGRGRGQGRRGRDAAKEGLCTGPAETVHPCAHTLQFSPAHTLTWWRLLLPQPLRANLCPPPPPQLSSLGRPRGLPLLSWSSVFLA